MDISQFGDPLEKIQLSNKLDETEKKMFQAGILSSESLREWNRNSLGRIRSTSEIDKKRKHRY
ncbi:hypothetical protein CPB97_002157 [Podila verticillata]|nr:hypothetical protein CPB97_002157 [Podila verticillata]